MLVADRAYTANRRRAARTDISEIVGIAQSGAAAEVEAEAQFRQQ